MTNRETRTVPLPAEEAEYVDSLVASGAYASESEVVRAGLQALQEREAAIDRWLEDEVVPVYDAMQRDPDRAISGREITAALASHHAERIREASVTREVVFAPEARDDLLELYNYIADQAGATRAHAYTGRIVSYCLGFTIFPERGRRRDDLRPGLRIIGFGRRVTIAFHVAGDRITIDRILYGGRDLTRAFRNAHEQ